MEKSEYYKPDTKGGIKVNASNYHEVMAELRQEYLESFDEKFKLWSQLFQDSNFESLELEFHKMKGTGATYGAPEVSHLCEHLERICRDQKQVDQATLSKAIALLEKIRDKYLNAYEFDLNAEKDFETIKSL